ncbi:MAG: tail fiber domain-containing protein [Rhodobacteraceae bacterium]|nr:tail fiber domain-containing protein [Paracoccaceae bacterium]
MICALIGVVVVGGVIALVRDNGGHTYPVSSDARLKTNLRHVDTLDNGIRLYAFQYLGDPQTFVGVKAQELADDVRFAPTVSVGPTGYLVVDYGKLGLKLANADAMKKSAQGALAVADSL